MTQDKIYIYGKHAVTEALRNSPQSVKKVYLAPHIKDEELLKLVKKVGVPSAPLTAGKSHGEVSDDASHQGVIGVISLEKIMRPYKDFMDTLIVTPDTSLVLLGELQDPHNVGAIIRSAAAFGVSGVLIPEHNQAPVTGTVVKVSAGMAFHIPLVTIPNVNTAVRDLKEKGFWIYGLDGEATHKMTTEKFDAPALFISGNEATGIREKTRELCDILISIPMNPQCESLNVAASTAVALYAWSAQHPKAVSKKMK